MTRIQWTDRTWNPVRGCTKVSAGCDNCYAMPQAHRFSGAGKPYEGLTRTLGGRPQWSGVVRTIETMLAKPFTWPNPCRVFVNSMSDLFHESVPLEFIDKVMIVMGICSHHTFQILTKRPGRARSYFCDETIERITDRFWPLYNEIGFCGYTSDGNFMHWFDYSTGDNVDVRQWPFPNVWLGVSVENQAAADERIPILLDTPTAVRWISAEPLLGPIDLSRWVDRLDWVVVGGESGRRARKCNLGWIRDIVRQCRSAGTKVFVKQLGSKPVRNISKVERIETVDSKGGDPAEWPRDIRVKEFPK